MKAGKITLLVLGLVVTLVGVAWMGQGSGYFPYPASSFMIDQRPWIWRGLAVAVIGLAMVASARRR